MGRCHALAVAVRHFRLPGNEDGVASDRDVAAELSKNVETRAIGGCKVHAVADPKTAAPQWPHSSARARCDGRATGIFYPVAATSVSPVCCPKSRHFQR